MTLNVSQSGLGLKPTPNRSFYLVRMQGVMLTRRVILLLLLERILSANVESQALRDDLAVLNPYAVEIRYPDEGFQPSAEDANEAREAAKRV